MNEIKLKPKESQMQLVVGMVGGGNNNGGGGGNGSKFVNESVMSLNRSNSIKP